MRVQRVTVALLSSVLLGLAPGTSAVAEGRTDLGRAATFYDCLVEVAPS